MKAIVAFLLGTAYFVNGQQLPNANIVTVPPATTAAATAPATTLAAAATTLAATTAAPVVPATTAAAAATTAAPVAPTTTAAAAGTTSAPLQPPPPRGPIRPPPPPPIVPLNSGSFSCEPPVNCAHRVVEVTPSQDWSMSCPGMGSCIGTTVNINVGFDPARIGWMVTRLGEIKCGGPSSCAGMTINIKNTLGIWATEPVQLNDLRCEVGGACNGLRIYAGPGVDIFTANFDCQQPGSCIACTVQDAAKLESCDANQNPQGAMLMPHQAPPLPPVPGMPPMPILRPQDPPSWIYSGNPANPTEPLMPGQVPVYPAGVIPPHQQIQPILPIQPIQPPQAQQPQPQQPAQTQAPQTPAQTTSTTTTTTTQAPQPVQPQYPPQPPQYNPYWGQYPLPYNPYYPPSWIYGQNQQFGQYGPSGQLQNPQMYAPQQPPQYQYPAQYYPYV